MFATVAARLDATADGFSQVTIYGPVIVSVALLGGGPASASMGDERASASIADGAASASVAENRSSAAAAEARSSAALGVIPFVSMAAVVAARLDVTVDGIAA